MMYIDVSWWYLTLSMIRCLPFLLLTKFYLQIFPSRLEAGDFVTLFNTIASSISLISFCESMYYDDIYHCTWFVAFNSSYWRTLSVLFFTSLDSGKKRDTQRLAVSRSFLLCFFFFKAWYVCAYMCLSHADMHAQETTTFGLLFRPPNLHQPTPWIACMQWMMHGGYNICMHHCSLPRRLICSSSSSFLFSFFVSSSSSTSCIMHHLLIDSSSSP